MSNTTIHLRANTMHLNVDIEHHHGSHCWHWPPPYISSSTHLKSVEITASTLSLVSVIIDTINAENSPMANVCIDVQRFRSRRPFSSKLIFQKGHDLADFSFYTFVSQTQVRHYPWKSSTNSEDTIWIDHSRWSLVLLGECDRVIQMSDHERLLLPQGSGLHYDSNPKKDSQQESRRVSSILVG